jgi:KRAB domain-containing zinc finger protein
MLLRQVGDIFQALMFSVFFTDTIKVILFSRKISEQQQMTQDQKQQQPQQQWELQQDTSGLRSNTEFTDGLLNESSLPYLPELLDPIKESNLESRSRISFNETGTVGSSGNSNLDNIPNDSSRKITEAHSDQTVYCKNIFSEDNFVSHQTAAVCDKTFCCSECHIVSASQHLNWKRNHSSKSVCTSISGENLLSLRNPSLQPVVVLERLKLFSKNECKIKHVQNKQNVEVCPLFPMKSHIDSSMVLPISETAETGSTSLDTSILDQNKEQDKTEVIETLDGHVTPEQRKLEEEGAQNNSEFYTKVYKEFENTNSCDTAKIIESINNIIKRNEEILSETATTKVEKSTVPSKELIEKVVKQKPKPILPQIKFEKKVHKFWKCMQCFNVLNTEKALRDHIRLKHPIIHKCQFCDKRVDSRRKFEQHMSIHRQEKCYMCEFCGRNFRLKRSLHNHLSLHNAEGKKFKCQQCGKKFATKERYAVHCISHDKASYLCDVCGKSMKYFNSLKVHRRTCADPSLAQKHSCVVCGKIYRDKYVHCILILRIL